MTECRPAKYSFPEISVQKIATCTAKNLLILDYPIKLKDVDAGFIPA